MGKIFTVLVISIFVANTCFALSLELSDVIKEAREIERIKSLQNSEKVQSLQPVKNELQINPFEKEKITYKKQQSNNKE